MDKCSKKIDKIVKNRIVDLKEFPSGRPAFFIYLILLVLSTYGFSNGIPWSSEAGSVLYYNAPSSWALGFENIKGLYTAIQKFNIEKSKTRFVEEVSSKNNIDSNIVKRFFDSRIVIISEEKKSFDFQEFFRNVMDIRVFLNAFFSQHEKNIICIEQFEGLETFMNVLSSFEVKSRIFGDFIAFSSNNEYLENQFQHMLNRNEFSKDVIFYSESGQENIEITNAYSFLNFEKKEMLVSKENPVQSQQLSQFLLDNVKIPFVFDNPSYFEINASNDLKTYFYENFEVHSSLGEWFSVFEMLKKHALYTFFFSNQSQWMLGFNFSDDLRNDIQWKSYISSWGLDSVQNIRPYTNDYYLTLYENYFIISNFEVEVLEGNNQIIAEMMTKFERNMLLKAEIIDLNDNPDISTIKIYHFSYIDDKIKKNLFRIF